MLVNLYFLLISMSTTVYDYAIIGAGAAGLHLAQAMIADDWFAEKQILILDKDAKEVDDKTWSYWEKGVGKWDDLIIQSWKKAQFKTKEKCLDLSLAPYVYKTLPSINFYQAGKQKIAQADNFSWIKEEVKEVLAGDVITIKGTQNKYQAKQVFDSRIDRKFEQKNDKYYRILQHFKGWVIETETPVFDTASFVMMDFQVKWKDSASFTYVLPITPTKAMVEFTLFTPELLAYEEYDTYLQKYIRDVLKIKKYQIEKVEYGVIPMSNYPFEVANQPGITKIGTAGAQVKASTGYAFKRIEKSAQLMISNLKTNRNPAAGLINKKFRLIDTLYLDVLTNHNHWGETLYTQIYENNDIQQVFKFLDDETNLLENFKLMNSLEAGPFLKAVVYHFLGIRIS